MTTALQRPASLLTVISDGQVIVGFSVSFTVTVKLHWAVLPEASVTSKVLVVVPTGKAAPLAKPAICVVAEPGQLSFPEGVV